jgi:PPOX class probable F420-dependent enzyme
MNLQPFEKQQYLNLETFRKNGQGVKTPVWFVQDGDALMIWTGANSGKAKRIRNNGKVRIVPSNASGSPSGEWVEAQAHVDDSSGTLAHVTQMFKKKYGLVFNFFALLNRKEKYAAVKVW